eukprot:gene20077-22047_t
MATYPVLLHVYDMYWLNDYTSSIGLGVYHTGIEVHGKEHAFGGHPFPFTGIFDMEPKDISELGEGFKFKETLAIGFTDLSHDDVEQILDNLGRKFKGPAYHLVKNNCNHFTSEFAKILCSKEIPKWVNRLAVIGAKFPFLCECIPKEWLTPEGIPYISDADLKEWVEVEGPLPDVKEHSLNESQPTKRTIVRVKAG